MEFFFFVFILNFNVPFYIFPLDFYGDVVYLHYVAGSGMYFMII